MAHISIRRFPYDHFTLVSDDDDKAIYAFLMTRRPVHAVAPANELPFPLNQRLVMYGWNLLFLHPGPYRADAAHDDIWNRGAYLAEGLGHCGACHTPRNILGAEQGEPKFAGGEGRRLDRLRDRSGRRRRRCRGLLSALAAVSRPRLRCRHGVARGPMAQVTSKSSGGAGRRCAWRSQPTSRPRSGHRCAAPRTSCNKARRKASAASRSLRQRRQPGQHVLRDPKVRKTAKAP